VHYSQQPIWIVSSDKIGLSDTDQSTAGPKVIGMLSPWRQSADIPELWSGMHCGMHCQGGQSADIAELCLEYSVDTFHLIQSLLRVLKCRMDPSIMLRCYNTVWWFERLIHPPLCSGTITRTSCLYNPASFANFSEHIECRTVQLAYTMND